MHTLRTFLTAVALIALAGGTAHAQGKATNGARGNSGQAAPGLEKKGGLPPGQKKKIYRTDEGAAALREIFTSRGYTVVRVTRGDGDVHHVFYRLRNGPVTRATVRPGTERLVFVSVPEAILRAVVARLY